MVRSLRRYQFDLEREFEGIAAITIRKRKTIENGNMRKVEARIEVRWRRSWTVDKNAPIEVDWNEKVDKSVKPLKLLIAPPED